jgi:hypothetical protein
MFQYAYLPDWGQVKVTMLECFNMLLCLTGASQGHHVAMFQYASLPDGKW